MRIPESFNECPPKSHEITQVNKNSANYAMVAFSANHIKSPSATVNRVLVATLELLQVLSAPGVPSQAVASLSSASQMLPATQRYPEFGPFGPFGPFLTCLFFPATMTPISSAWLIAAAMTLMFTDVW